MPEQILYLIVIVLTVYAIMQIRSKYSYFKVIHPKKVSLTKSVLGPLILSFMIVWGFTGYVVWYILPDFDNTVIIGFGMAVYFIAGNVDLYFDAVIRTEIESD